MRRKKNILTRHGYKINGIYSKDELPKDLQEGFYVINMQNHDKRIGTHWIAFRYSKDVVSILIVLEYNPPSKY